MKLPLSWLREYVDFDDTVEGLAARLTFSGTEVEGIETFGALVDGVVVGEVLSKKQHPNADRLSVCVVSDGTNEYQVVCGAPNVVAGGKYPFAPVGTTLPGDFKIKKAKIRGEASFGMLCAEDELGLSDKHDGLMELSEEAVTGSSLQSLLGEPETVLELEVTPNRADCLSIIGMAREVAALYGTTVKYPELVIHEENTDINELTSVEIADPDLCARYTARVLSDIKLAPSPQWMRNRLEWVGLRPINNIVDITNYVLLEYGQPLHAFDMNKLSEQRIIVRRANEKEMIETLDGSQCELTHDMLVIADAERPVALGGVMGGAHSEISPATTNVLLESACFDPDNIRLTGRALAMSSESSYRFERGVDRNGVMQGSLRAAMLMQQLAGAKIARGVIDVFPGDKPDLEVSFSWDKMRVLLSLPCETEKVISMLASIGIQCVSNDETTCVMQVPSMRADVTRDVDLFEEYARLVGLDAIDAPAPNARVVLGADDSEITARFTCAQRLAALGLSEIQNYSLVSEKILKQFSLLNEKAIRIPNPISKDQSILRNSLIPQLVETLGRNHARQVQEVALFESGRVFFREADGNAAEGLRVSLGLKGPVNRSAVDKRSPVQPSEMFLWMKGLVGALMDTQGLSGWSVEPVDMPFMEPSHAVQVMLNGSCIGFFGLLKATLRSDYRFSDPVAIGELHMDALIANRKTPVAVKVPSVYPSTERDIALIATTDLLNEDIEKVILNAAPKELESIELFDIYEGKNIAEGHRSLAYSLVYRAIDRTMTDEEVNAFHERIKDALRKALRIELRES
ncbi:MAG: phenylalanine--tRNA ligase subunit beta [Spartobacteria bacterium]|nr:phenylalanine--tRNA ligase subunit beta [Spartobacteria bacterium]